MLSQAELTKIVAGRPAPHLWINQHVPAMITRDALRALLEEIATAYAMDTAEVRWDQVIDWLSIREERNRAYHREVSERIERRSGEFLDLAGRAFRAAADAQACMLLTDHRVNRCPRCNAAAESATRVRNFAAEVKRWARELAEHKRIWEDRNKLTNLFWVQDGTFVRLAGKLVYRDSTGKTRRATPEEEAAHVDPPVVRTVATNRPIHRTRVNAAGEVVWRGVQPPPEPPELPPWPPEIRPELQPIPPRVDERYRQMVDEMLRQRRTQDRVEPTRMVNLTDEPLMGDEPEAAEPEVAVGGRRRIIEYTAATTPEQYLNLWIEAEGQTAGEHARNRTQLAPRAARDAAFEQAWLDRVNFLQREVAAGRLVARRV